MPEPITEFSTPDPTPNPAQPDFTTKGLLLNIAAPDTSPLTSKSLKVNDRPAAFQKNIYAASDVAGAFDVEVLLDESERSGGNAVWRKITASPVTVTANVLAVFTTTLLFEQMRVVYTPGAAGNVKVWGFSLP